MKTDLTSSVRNSENAPVDSGYWSNLQTKIAIQKLDDFEEWMAVQLDQLEKKYSNFVTRQSTKSAVRR